MAKFTDSQVYELTGTKPYQRGDGTETGAAAVEIKLCRVRRAVYVQDFGPFPQNRPAAEMFTMRELFELNDAAEVRARLRSLRALAKVLCGKRAAALAKALADSETDPACLPTAMDALENLSPLDQRRILGTWMQTLPGIAP